MWFLDILLMITIRVAGAYKICYLILINTGPLVFFDRYKFAVIVEKPIFSNTMNSSEFNISQVVNKIYYISFKVNILDFSHWRHFYPHFFNNLKIILREKPLIYRVLLCHEKAIKGVSSWFDRSFSVFKKFFVITVLFENWKVGFRFWKLIFLMIFNSWPSVICQELFCFVPAFAL